MKIDKNKWQEFDFDDVFTISHKTPIVASVSNTDINSVITVASNEQEATADATAIAATYIVNVPTDSLGRRFEAKHIILMI